MSKDVNVHVKTETDKQKVDAYGNAFDRAGGKVNDAGSQAQSATRKMNILGSAVNSVTSFLTGLVGIAGLWAFFQKWLSYINKISEAQKKLVESTKSLDHAAKSLASQADVMHIPGGVEAARKQVLDIQTAGKLSSFEAAEAVALSTHSAFGTSGQLLTPGQLGIAGTVANFSRLKDVGPESIGPLLKVLSSMGVSNEQEAAWRIQQSSIVQQKSNVEAFRDFIPSAVSSMIPAMAKGASPEMALSQYAAALNTVNSPALAASATKQAADIMLRPGVAEAIGGDFANLPYDQQITALSQWATRSSLQQLLAAKLEPTQAGQLKGTYKDGQLGLLDLFSGLSAKATPQQLFDRFAGWDITTPGIIEAIEAEAVRAEATATPEERVGQALIKAGEAQWERVVADKQDKFMVSDELEKSRLVWQLLKKRMDAVIRAKYGDDPVSFIDDPELRRVRRHILDEAPSIIDPLTAGEVGKMDAMLKPLEEQAGITNIHYHNDTIFARPGVDPTPRVAPADLE